MTRLRPEPRHLPLALAVLALAAHAQERATSGTTIKPRIGLSQSWTDNLNLDEHNKDAALITTVSPGISIVSNSGAVRGTLDYSLNGITYLKSTQGSRLQNSLSASGQAEVIPRIFYVDAQASISQQDASAFGLRELPTVGTDGGISSLANPNRRETGTLSVSPLLRGQIGGFASVDLRGSFSAAEVRGSSLGDGHNTGVTLRLAQLKAGVLSWYALISAQQAGYAGTSSNRSKSVTGGATYQPNNELTVSADVGQESSDYASGGSDTQSGFTGGGSVTWTPTPRTVLSGNWQKHRYGDGHGLSFEHRMARSVWRLSDSSSTTLGSAGASSGVRTNYQLYYLLYASQIPDPIQRDQYVRAFLQAVGLSPDAPSATGFLSSGPSRLRNQLFSFALQGVRTNLTALISRAITSRLGDNLNQGDLATNSHVEQRSYSLSGSYKLSEISSLALTASRQETSGDPSSPRSNLTSLTANWNGRLNPRLSVQLGTRHSRFEGTTSYAENAVYANVTQQF